MSRKPLKPPSRVIVLNGRPVTLTADYNAMYALEELTGRNIFELVNEGQNARVYTTVAQLAYALSTSHREDAGEGDTPFRQWLRHLPPIHKDEFEALSTTVIGLFREALEGREATPGNAPAPELPASEAPSA